MAGDNQQFCLRWNNHQSTLISVFDSLLESGTLVDCTLAAEGQYLKAHKVVLSACSPYLELLLSQHYEKHPIVILKDVKFQELKSMMDYMYRGEVNITQDQLATFLKAAESLQIKGLSESSGSTDDARDVGSTAKRPREEPPPRRPVPPHPQARLPHSSGLTIEPRRSIPHSSEMAPASPMKSREGSTSPVARKRRRRRPSGGDDASNAALSDSQLDTSNSCDLPPVSNQAQSTPISVPSILATPSASNNQSESDQPLETEALSRFPNTTGSELMVKTKMEPNTDQLIEPKTEYLEDINNEDSVEDLTLDDDDEMPGPSHADGSNQNFSQWQMAGDRSTDEVFMAAQEAVGAHRDSQDLTKTTYSVETEGYNGAYQNERPSTIHPGKNSLEQAELDGDLIDLEEMTFVDVKPVSSELEQRDDPTPEVACEEPFDLARLLSEQIKGKMIMRTFQARGELAAEERRQLADLILTAEIGGDPNKMIPPDRFAELARQVAQVFPTESSRLYYSKSDQVATIDGKTRKKARGILYDKFTHLRRKFRAKGLIDQPYGRTSSSSSSPSTSTASKGKKILEGDERSEWLQSHLQPWEQVVEYWRMTYEHRASNLKLPETNILEYFNKYPALKQPAGCNLLLQDFNVKYNRYPQLHRNLLESWPIHREKIIALLERKCRTERAFKSLISSHGLDLENIADPFDRDVLAFKSLGFLLPCAIGPRDKSSKKSSRYSKTQASDALLLRIPNPAQLPATVAARNECLQNFGLAGNPYPVFVAHGQTRACQVLAGGTNYVFDSPLKMVDACFKIFHALGTSYPPDGKLVWTFVQKFLYRLNTPYDCNYPSLYQLAVELDIDSR
ncbi:uncharacterized protein [Bemisia tabaci]|uniref:uncharacterized protein isoform X3 n=1 Tax=Bemisia tabaci TaxID=7038 RepID=UPI0008F9D2B4|nr:PREDICTED: uncharacterized protein LOC109037149 isoform X2 [Bemisia tabaci]